MTGTAGDDGGQEKISAQLEAWLGSDRKKTLGDLVDTFGPRSFAILFVVLMALPALPLPTGAVSHVLEIVTMLLALELVIGRTEVWIPHRFEDKELKGLTGPKFSGALVKRIRWFERFSRPRMAALLESRLTGVVLGVAVFGLALTAFLSPPFSGLDTLPSLGVVVLGLGVLLGDIVVAGVGLGLGVAGVVVVVGLGKAITQLL
ncbi:MAG TPA: exopolysaccharide biosynthesis protein [Acidimicrobiia bacterium]|nr:exopolysaccharide biosynthesis protein [Acidimicrobiia bacterium]HZQ76947.1 exopolysaccharide biosynthesis protein [Acidimicrobiia bacterium]